MWSNFKVTFDGALTIKTPSNVGNNAFVVNNGSDVFKVLDDGTQINPVSKIGQTYIGNLSGYPILSIGTATPDFTNYTLIWGAGLGINTPTGYAITFRENNNVYATLKNGGSTDSYLDFSSSASPSMINLYNGGTALRYGFGIQSGQLNINTPPTGATVSIGALSSGTHTSKFVFDTEIGRQTIYTAAALGSNNAFVVNNGSDVFKILDNGNTENAGWYKSADPGQGAGQWKLGKKITATVSLVTTDYIEVEIDGVDYKLALATV